MHRFPIELGTCIRGGFQMVRKLVIQTKVMAKGTSKYSDISDVSLLTIRDRYNLGNFNVDLDTCLSMEHRKSCTSQY